MSFTEKISNSESDGGCDDNDEKTGEDHVQMLVTMVLIRTALYNLKEDQERRLYKMFSFTFSKPKCP